MVFQVEIYETLSKIVSEEAASESETIEQVKKKYNEGEIVLDAANFVDVDFQIFD